MARSEKVSIFVFMWELSTPGDHNPGYEPRAQITEKAVHLFIYRNRTTPIARVACHSGPPTVVAYYTPRSRKDRPFWSRCDSNSTPSYELDIHNFIILTGIVTGWSVCT